MNYIFTYGPLLYFLTHLYYVWGHFMKARLNKWDIFICIYIHYRLKVWGQ